MSDYPNPPTDYSPKSELNEPGDFARRTTANAFSEDDELGLASESLEINNEQDLAAATARTAKTNIVIRAPSSPVSPFRAC